MNETGNTHATVFGLMQEEAEAEARRLAQKDAEKLALARKSHKVEQECIARRRAAEARIPDDMQRREFAIEGMRRMARRLEREGDGTRAKNLSQLADEAGSILRDYVAATIELQARRPDPLGDAVERAAAELRKRLPACYPTDEDATAAARLLPLAEARREAGRLADHYHGVAKNRAKIGAAFWHSVETATRAAGLSDAREFVRLGLV